MRKSKIVADSLYIILQIALWKTSVTCIDCDSANQNRIIQEPDREVGLKMIDLPSMIHLHHEVTFPLFQTRGERG
jgi:hypothetical protein